MKRSIGAASVEFAIVATVAVIPFVLGILQIGLLYGAKHTLNLAVFQAARAGAVHHADRAVMQRYLAKGLTPLHIRSTRRLDEDSWAAEATRAYARAYAEVRLPIQTRMRIFNPTAASFADFGQPGPAGPEIPNDPRLPRSFVGTRSQQTLGEANLLGVRVEYCHRLIVPLADRLITSVLRRTDLDAFRQGCYAQRRLPIVASALVQMATPPRRDVMGELG